MPNEIQPDLDNSKNSKPEFNEKWSPRKKKIAGLLAGIALTAGVAGGIGNKFLNQNNPNTTKSAEELSEEQKIKSFVSKYGDRYQDPNSVYYAEKAYQKSGAESLILTDSYINDYVEKYVSEYHTGNTIGNEVSPDNPFGFEKYKLPKDAEINRATSIEIFNNYTAGQMSKYMNAYARNVLRNHGGGYAESVLDTEFLGYCTNNLPDILDEEKQIFIDNTYDNDAAYTLTDLMNKIVSKYGNTANYTVSLASSQNNTAGLTDKKATLFKNSETTKGPFERMDIQGTWFYDTVDLIILVDKYSGKKSSIKIEQVRDLEFIVCRVDNVADDSPYAYISIGLR